MCQRPVAWLQQVPALVQSSQCSGPPLPSSFTTALWLAPGRQPSTHFSFHTSCWKDLVPVYLQLPPVGGQEGTQETYFLTDGSGA